jgi:hypothetical protein
MMFVAKERQAGVARVQRTTVATAFRDPGCAHATISAAPLVYSTDTVHSPVVVSQEDDGNRSMDPDTSRTTGSKYDLCARS